MPQELPRTFETVLGHSQDVLTMFLGPNTNLNKNAVPNLPRTPAFIVLGKVLV